LNDQGKEDEEDSACSTERNAYKILMGMPEGNRPLGIRWIILKWILLRER
jgi:hypothetical protein